MSFSRSSYLEKAFSFTSLITSSSLIFSLLRVAKLSIPNMFLVSYNNPDLLIDVLINVINTLRKLDNYKCPFNSIDNYGNDFVHGDLCLPNILVDNDNKFAGFIDLDNSGLGDKWYDYSWLLWSLEYNLKTSKYNKVLLDRLNLKFDKEKYNKYIPEEYRKNNY